MSETPCRAASAMMPLIRRMAGGGAASALNLGNTVSPSGNVRIADQMPIVPVNAMVKDPKILKPLYEGTGSSILYTKPHLLAWATPVFIWCCFILALGSVMICMNVILRKQWMENEKLSYPIVQLPMAMTQDGGTLSFFQNRPFWIGILLGAALDIWNGLTDGVQLAKALRPI